MRFARLLILIAAAMAAPWAVGPLAAETQPGPAYLGAWLIETSTPAPWIKSDAELFEDERAELVGKRIVFTRKAILAPAPMGCKRPRYRVRSYPADMLFQGVLTLPATQAAALGFAGGSIATLETGCEGPLDYHFRDSDTGMFALNNAIYLMRKVR